MPYQAEKARKKVEPQQLFTRVPKDFVSHRNINNIFEEASPRRDKLEFVGLKARGILSPRRGRQNISPGWSCVSCGTLGKTKNISEPRSVAEWVAARHGVGREPGDGKLWLSVLAALSATRSLRSGFRVYLTPNPAFGASRLALLACYALAGRRIAAPRWAMILSPLRAQISATLTLRKLLCKFQFIGLCHIFRTI